jgi:hypothetical protein
MKRIYTAAHLPDAHIVANLLRHAGIAVQVFNVNAAGAFGELPMESSLPQVWLEQDKDEDKARALIETYQRTADSSIVRPCSQCGEENPIAFETCWSCGKAV